MRSRIVKRSIVIGGHKTSVSLEDPFWLALKDIARQRSKTLSELAGEIDSGRGEDANLSSAIRLYVLSHYRDLADRSVAEQPIRQPAMQTTQRSWD